jgi:hypothetical protein
MWQKLLFFRVVNFVPDTKNGALLSFSYCFGHECHNRYLFGFTPFVEFQVKTGLKLGYEAQSLRLHNKLFELFLKDIDL